MKFFPIVLLCAPLLGAQAADDTRLKQVIIFGRHSVRAPLAPNSVLNLYSAQPFPQFSVAPSYLTPNGAALEKILGGYYRAWLTQEKLLTGNDAADAKTIYVRANNLQRTIATAQAFASGLLPADTPAGRVDVTALPIDASLGFPGLPVDLGGLITLETVISPFLLEYADGMPSSEVAWGQITPAGISQLSRISALVLDLESRTPYIARVQSSNLASHLVRSLVQAATGNAMAGSLGNPQTKAIVLIASDLNIAALAGLLHLGWTLPGYQENFCALGGSLVFELRQSLRTGQYLLRLSYVAQTLDQLRSQTVLTLTAPPARAPIFIPGCSTQTARFDCPLSEFVRLADQAIDLDSADLQN